MNSRVKSVGRVIIPESAVVKPHELSTARVLSRTGNDVEFISVRNIPTPDIKFMGQEWEIKSPVGGSSRTIENNLRSALKQSQNIVIDLSRIKRLEVDAIREVKRQVGLLRGVGKVIIVTKAKKVVWLI